MWPYITNYPVWHSCRKISIILEIFLMTYITLTFNIQVDSYYHYFYRALQVPTCRCQLQFSHNWVAWPQGPRIRIRIVMKSFPDWPHNSLSGIGGCWVSVFLCFPSPSIDDRRCRHLWFVVAACWLITAYTAQPNGQKRNGYTGTDTDTLATFPAKA